MKAKQDSGNDVKVDQFPHNVWSRKRWKKMKEKFLSNLDCWPSGRFCVGFMVPPDEQATMIFELLSNFDSIPDPCGINK